MMADPPKVHNKCLHNWRNNIGPMSYIPKEIQGDVTYYLHSTTNVPWGCGMKIACKGIRKDIFSHHSDKV